MKKEDLIKLGLDEEMATRVETASNEELKGYVAKDDYDTLAKEKETLETSITMTLEEHTKSMNELKINNAVEVALIKSNAKNHLASKALLDMSKIEVSEDGTVSGLSEQIDSLISDESTKFLFGTEVVNLSAVIDGVKPGEGNVGVVEGITKEQFSKMGYKERAQLFETDKATYDALSKE